MNKLIKLGITRSLAIDIDKLYKRVDNYQIISFDMFDTLVTRIVPSSDDVIKLMSQKASEMLDITSEAFVKMRLEIWNTLFKNMYPYYPTLYNVYKKFNIIDEQIEKLIQLESQTELYCCRPRAEIVDIMNYCLNKGKKVIIVSDTPLSMETIKNILKKFNINGYSNIYLSSKNGSSKYSGELFNKVLTDEKCDSSEILHIGDSPRSDFLNPRSKGINGTLIKRISNIKMLVEIRDKHYYENNLDYRVLRKFISLYENANYGIYEKMGYEILGPLLLSFSQWINNCCAENTKIIFLAREGVILKKAFNILYPNRKNDTELLRVSRRAITVCSLYDVYKCDQLFDLLKTFSVDSLTLKEIVDLGYITIDQAVEFAKKYSITLDTNIISENGLTRYFENEILPLIRNYSIRQNTLFRTYLEEKIDDAEHVAIVDVGWRGTMQDRINDSFSECFHNAPVGYYFGVKVDPRITHQTLENKFGALYKEKIIHSDDYYCICLTGQVFEMFFMDIEHGTTSGYELKDDRVLPYTMRSEYSGDARYALESLQNAAFKFIQDYLIEFRDNHEFYLSCHSAFQQYKETFQHPNNDLLKSIKIFDTNDVEVTPLLSNRSFWFWLLHPRKLKENFLNNHSKSLFLQSVFHIPLPYYDVLKEYQKHKGM